MVAGRDKYGNVHLFQHLPQGKIAVLGIAAVKQVAGQQHHITVFCFADFADFPGDIQKLFPEKPGLLRRSALQGRI